MEKKKVLDKLYHLREKWIKKAHSRYQESIDNKNDVSINNLRIGESRGYEGANKELNVVIEEIINLDN